MTEKTVQKIDVFISSPGDVVEERKVASEVIGQLNSMPYIADRCTLKPLAYEKIVPAAVGETAQKTVDRYMMEADKSDIFICILWSRMGTPVIDNEGKEYQSGTEYEFTSAYRANQKSGKPHILLYRSMKNLPHEADLKQVELVRAFFKSFDGKEADRKGFYKKYRSNEEFKENLHHDLEVIISQFIQPEVAGKRPSVPKEIKKYIPPSLPPYPLKLKEFVTQNRAEELKKAREYLQDHQILFINGLGGIGKTTLARALVELRTSDVKNPFWFDFSKKMDATLEDVLEELSGYLDAPDIAGFRNEKRDAGQHDIDLLICKLQDHEPVWLVFDNLETILESESTKFRDPDMDSLFISLRDNSHQAKIIITSRTLPVLRSGISYIDMVYNEKQELKGLKTRDAIDYLIKNGLEGLDSDELEKLAIGVDGHPLALELLIQLVKKFGVKDTLKDLSMYQKLRESTIKKARRIFEKLAGDEKELLERISVFRRPESLDAMKIMFTDKTSDNAIGNLLDRSLLETDLNGNYWLHPLVREFSYDDLKDRKDVHERAYEYYLSLPDPRTKKEDIQPLIEAHYHACMAEDYDTAASIIFVNNLDEDLDRWGNYRTLIELYMSILPKDHFRNKPLLKDKKTHSIVLGNLGIAYSRLSQVDKAIKYYEQALAIAQEIGDRGGEGNWLGNLGYEYNNLGRVEKAIKYYERALSIDQEIGNRGGESVRVVGIGNAYFSLGQVEKAIEYYEKALAIAQEIRNRRNECECMGSLGNAYFSLSQVEKAIEYYEQSLAIAQEIGDRNNEGADLGSLGNAYYSLGQVEKGIKYYECALAIAQEIGGRRNEGVWLGNLGLAYSALGQVDKAIKYYEQALAIAQEIGDRGGEGNWLGNLGYEYNNLGQVEKAIKYYERALAIDQEIGDRRNEGVWLRNLGLAYSALGQVEKATKYYEQALAIGKEIKDPRIINLCEEKLGSMK